MSWAHPAAGFLFFQGRLESEFDGRVARLRQEVRDADATELADNRSGVADRLFRKFALTPVQLGTGREFAGESTGELTLHLPFEGSSVLLHRRPPGAPEAALAGRVTESVTIVDGVRHRRGRIQVPVPEDVSAAHDRSAWADTAEGEVRAVVELANAALAEFLPRLHAAALDAIDRRLERVGGARPA